MADRDPRSDARPSHVVSAGGGPVEAASLVAEAVAELAQLSRRHRLDMLAHLLEMAKLEADEFLRRESNFGRF